MQRFCKILITVCVACLCLVQSHAQVRTLADTLSTISPDFYRAFQEERSRRQKSDSFYFQTYRQRQLQFSQQNITQLLADTLKQAALLQLQYGNRHRNFRLPTNAHKTQLASLYTEGFTTIGRAKISGKFYFDKVWEDSLANNLDAYKQEGLPYTHFATKAGTYERQNYNFEAGVGFRAIDGLYINSMINYDYHWSTGSVDPRPEERIFHIQYKPGVSYKIGRTLIGADYLLGKTDGAIDIVYKNRMFNTSQLYPDRRLYLNNGYGYISQRTSAAYADYDIKSDGWQVHAATSLANWKISSDYSNIFNVRRNFNRVQQLDSTLSPILENAHSRYELLQQELNAMLSNETEVSIHQLLLNAAINEGTGFLMSIPNGASYLFDQHKAHLSYLLSLKRSGKLATEIGLDANMEHFFKKDFLSLHFFENTRAGFHVKAGKYFYGPKQMIKVVLEPGFIMPIKNVLTVPDLQVNIFTRNIAYPEYDYFGSGFLSGRLGVNWYLPRLMRMAGSAVKLDLQYLHKTKNSDINTSLYQARPGADNQLNVSVGFQIFL